MSSSELRELFDGCKNGDLSKVKKLLTSQNVNEIGEFSEGDSFNMWNLQHIFSHIVSFNVRHCWQALNSATFCERIWTKRHCRIFISKRSQYSFERRWWIVSITQVSIVIVINICFTDWWAVNYRNLKFAFMIMLMMKDVKNITNNN